jgi:hypothetical protein
MVIVEMEHFGYVDLELHSGLALDFMIYLLFTALKVHDPRAEKF